MFTNSESVAAATGSDQRLGLEVGRGAIKPSEMFPASISAAGLRSNRRSGLGIPRH